METEREKRQTMYEENQSPESVYDALIAEAPQQVEVAPTPSAWATLQSEAIALKSEVDRLTNLQEYYQKLISEERRTRATNVSDLETYLDENWNDLGDHAEAIGDIFGIEAEKSIEISITVDYTVTVTVPRNKVEEISGDNFEFDVVSNPNWLHIEDSSSYVRDIEF